jgi:hypothetical protein
LQDRPGSTLLFLAWSSDSVQRGVVVLVQAIGGYEVRGVVHRPGEEPDVRGITRSPKLVDADALTITVRLAMEAVEEWRPAVPATP